MKKPSLLPGQRYHSERPISGGDSLYMAEVCLEAAAQQKKTLVVCADAQDSQRLLDEWAFLAPSLRCALFPDWETLPYDHFSPHQDLISERLSTLWRLISTQDHEPIDVVLVSASTVLTRLPPPSFLSAYTFMFKQGQAIDEQGLKAQLTLAGYQAVSEVISPGEYAIRGSIIDLFPMGAVMPYRIDLFDQEIDSIRTFDPEHQRSLYPVPEIRLLPGREFPLDEASQQTFRARWRELIEGDPTQSRLYKDIGNGIASGGIEYYLPLFFEKTATLIDYIGHKAQLILHGEVDHAFQAFTQDTQERFRLMQSDPDRPALAPHLLFLSSEAFYLQAQDLAQWALRHLADPKNENPFHSLPDLSVQRTAQDPLTSFKHYLEHQQGACLVVAESQGRLTSLQDFFKASNIELPVFDSLHDFIQAQAKQGIAVAQLARGFCWKRAEGDLSFITETELFSVSASTRRRKKQEKASDVETLIKDLSELNIGDPIVHAQHGIGRYQGLIHMNLQASDSLASCDEGQEFLHLLYANDAVLYVPVTQLHLISRYTGVSSDEAPLHRLGSGQWEKAKRKAAEQVRDTAAELLNLYARRALKKGQSFSFPAQEYEKFIADFGFEETADQKAAIHAVIQDMVADRPMDRLICGDVGFGKTEVALRAAFIAVMNGRQVAFLAPTTLLAEQHYQTLCDRFSKWPVRIAEMSRFRSAKEIKVTMEALSKGLVDIVVGTHKLLSPDIQYQRLGLLIIDEEHRFGVRHKEALKTLRSEVDVLTLTATPIPRTLGMALEGLRELSVIATAPQRRLSIKTFVRNEGQGVIREAVLREFKRGGQVYFLHNEVETIENRKQALASILPEARIAIAHGQMPERQLEMVMRDFHAQRHNLLLCSTIIETGIDIPSANTIIIARADKFGLAQLHQLRGRVGRSHHQAYAYLMVPDIDSLTKQASQRLEAIQQMEELGSGFYLAMHDLEIRGAGEVLGDQQSGNMMAIGFQLYNEMLSSAVSNLKAGREPDLINPITPTIDINLHTPTLLPDSYCGDVHLRLSFYKKLATASSAAHLDQLVEELVDRFGKLPVAAQHLMDMHRLRLLCHTYGVTKLDASAASILINFKAQAPIDPAAIIRLIQSHKDIKLAGNDRLKIQKELPEVSSRIQMIRDVFRSLGPPTPLPSSI